MATHPTLSVKGYLFEQVLPSFAGEETWRTAYSEGAGGVQRYSFEVELRHTGSVWQWSINADGEKIVCSSPPDCNSPELALDAALQWIREQYDGENVDETQQERTSQETLELANFALHRLSEEWLQNELGEDITDVIMDALNLLVEQTAKG